MEVSRATNDMIRRTYDMDIVNSILQHPDIWKDIAPEGIEPFDPPYLSDVLYFIVNDGDGVITAHPFRDGCKIHPNILPDKRGKLAYEAVEEACQAIFEHGYTSIYAEIDPKLRHVVMFAKTLGFKPLESDKRDLFIRRLLNS